MSARALAVLDRFPQHVAASDPEKRFELVVGSLVDALEVLTRQAADVRRAHRLAEEPTTADLALLAGLHALRAPVFAPLMQRLQARPQQPGYDAGLALRRAVVSGAIGAHSIGNATPHALLSGVAAYLGFAIDSVTPTPGRWWTLARCHDLIEPHQDLVALEENPFHHADLDPAPRPHGQRFRIVRGGLEDVDVTVRVLGTGARTVRPMVVDVLAGHGLAWEGTVPDGSELRFEASGQVTLDGGVVTGSAWEFRGAVFADARARLLAGDFVFADPASPRQRDGHFVTTAPLSDALDDAAAFPHGAATTGPLRLRLGQTYWAAFVRIDHTSTLVAGASAPRNKHARFDHAVLADGNGLDGPTAGDPSFRVGFEWEEREPFAVRILLPRRLMAVDDEKGSKLREPLRQLLDRHRAAGVDLRVEYADPRWTVGTGVVRDTEDPDEHAIGTVVAGTELWPDGTPQPGPS
jgi:hypothetical protein